MSGKYTLKSADDHPTGEKERGCDVNNRLALHEDEKGVNNEAFQPNKSDTIINTYCDQDDDYENNNILDEKENCCTEKLGKLSNQFKDLCDKYKCQIKLFILVSLFILYTVYWGFAISISWSPEKSWCDGVKFLTLINICAYTGLFYNLIVKRYLRKKLSSIIKRGGDRIFSVVCRWRYCGIVFFIIVLICILIFVVIDSEKRHEKIMSYAGIISLLAFGFVFSKNPHKIRIRHVSWGLALQFIFALLILRWPVGKEIFVCLGNKINDFFAFTDRGSELVFGYLASGKLSNGNATISQLVAGNSTIGTDVTAVNMILPLQMTVFAFKILPVICFFSFCISVLYYYGIMQWLVIQVGWLLQITVGTTAAESLSAAANIFMGQTEAPLVIRPYLSLMTKSELHAIMTGGFATIAGAVMAAYIRIGINASHLLSASVMSAPAALAYSKLFYPETEVSVTKVANIKIDKSKERNALEAATKGVTVSVTLMANIAANLLAFTAFIYFIDALVIWFGTLVGWNFLSLTFIMAKIFKPLAFLMGVQWDECEKVGELIGIKTIVNEFVAYERLSQIKDTLSPRTETIATYALCGFSNLASVGIQLGGLGAMAPDRIKDLAQVAMRAMISGSAACFLTACIAGALMTDENLPVRL